ncbi:MAG: NAD-dependent succinate-semialdehyde dehydrogenase [Firmicutes bacterium]|nr:NAD-dependent succinate-semialdehyde dehydrogenase [Bacillota bacterium]
MEIQLYYRGEWHPGTSGQRFFVENPATTEIIGSAVLADLDDVSLAIEGAVQAFPVWSRRPSAERGHQLQRIYQAIMDQQEALARLLTLEEGKSLSESRSEVAYGARFFEYYAGQAQRVYGRTMPSPSPSRAIWTTKVPIGVTAIITPWNYPFAMICRKMAPALAAGCTVVVKPAEQTPLIAGQLFALLHDLSLPPGVVNLITGDPGIVGTALVQDVRVRKVSFTGSTAVGRVILHNAAENITSVSLELGGNAPFVIFDDADLDNAVAGIMTSKFRNAGQICVATNRIYVQRSLVPLLAERLAQSVTALKVGNGLDPETQIGPLINHEGVDKVSRHIADAVQRGASVITGGLPLTVGSGYFYAPTVLVDVDESMVLAKEETFGPVAPLFVFDTEDEVYERANMTPYGLVAYVYTRDLGRAMRASQAMEFGMVGINDPVPSLVEAPIGGVKASGLGREGGSEGIEEFLETKYVSMRF